VGRGSNTTRSNMNRSEKRVDSSLKGALASLSSSNIWDFAVVNYFICFISQLSYNLARNEGWLSINQNKL